MAEEVAVAAEVAAEVVAEAEAEAAEVIIMFRNLSCLSLSLTPL